MQNTDDEFYERADAHIHLSNDQISEETGQGKVSASMMYATARFNSWISATGWHSSEELSAAKDETIEYFVTEYRKMLEENLDDYIDNFESYMEPPSNDTSSQPRWTASPPLASIVTNDRLCCIAVLPRLPGERRVWDAFRTFPAEYLSKLLGCPVSAPTQTFRIYP